MMMYILISLVVPSLATVGIAACSTFTTSANCLASGYCYMPSATCIQLDCYQINEVGACRNAGGFVGILSSTCTTLEQFSLQYSNVCVNTGQIAHSYGLIRYVTSTATGTWSTTTSGTTITALQAMSGQALSDNLFQLYTLNVFDSTLTNANLNSIISTYITFASTSTYGLRSTQSHPFYMEKLIYQSLQVLREDETLTKATVATKQASVTLILSFIDKYYLRLNAFQSYYVTNYYFVNFAQTPISRLALTVNGQLHSQTLTWTTYSQNGLMQVVSYDCDLWGIYGAYTDLISVKAYGTTTSVAIAVPLTITWQWSDPTFVLTTNTFYVYSVSLSSLNTAPTQIGSLVPATNCVLASNTCTYTVTTSSSGWYSFYVAPAIATCASRTLYYQCRLSMLCTWTTTTWPAGTCA